jgi:cysteine desulfurase/selenocysteine lyase
VHRGLHYLANAATKPMRAAAPRWRSSSTPPDRRDHLHPQRHRGDQPRRSSWGEPNIKAGDEIVLSIMEHHSNIVPWHFLRERHGAVIKWAPVDDDGNFLIDEFEKL